MRGSARRRWMGKLMSREGDEKEWSDEMLVRDR